MEELGEIDAKWDISMKYLSSYRRSFEKGVTEDSGLKRSGRSNQTERADHD